MRNILCNLLQNYPFLRHRKCAKTQSLTKSHNKYFELLWIKWKHRYPYIDICVSFLWRLRHINKSPSGTRLKLCRISFHDISFFCAQKTSKKQIISHKINIYFSIFWRKFQYIDIIYSQNNGTSQQVEVQKRFRIFLPSTCQILMSTY